MQGLWDVQMAAFPQMGSTTGSFKQEGDVIYIWNHPLPCVAKRLKGTGAEAGRQEGAFGNNPGGWCWGHRQGLEAEVGGRS